LKKYFGGSDWIEVFLSQKNERLTGKEIALFYQIRWDIEILFKPWESHLKS
jgi:IS4 transposase